ncbi:reverse transcriptase N-terminal domain-containing protein [Streptomyces mirabilis]|uniref:reverse transcriptase N-terminal domain-containing protein n=1 Tax=Streptomyces mirabilis TaxID=68239 RepID=UPI0036E78D15
MNGPEDELLDWHAIDWDAAEESIRRLRQRIFAASQAGDLKRVTPADVLAARDALKHHHEQQMADASS